MLKITLEKGLKWCVRFTRQPREHQTCNPIAFDDTQSETATHEDDRSSWDGSA